MVFISQVAIEGAPTPSDEMKSGSKRKSRSDEVISLHICISISSFSCQIVHAVAYLMSLTG